MASTSSSATPKNIVICSDGTGNTANKNRGTNVFKLYESLDLNNAGGKPQLGIYHDGVGTEKLKLIRALAGAFGIGLSRQVKQLYAEIARAYAPGDRLFLFGFSRGAFTVRTLAGLIHHCGIIDVSKVDDDKHLEKLAKKAYRAYRKNYRTVTLEVLHWMREKLSLLPDGTPAQNFCKAYAHGFQRDSGSGSQDPCKGKVIAFLGVWDTVDAVGFPVAGVAKVFNTLIYRFKFKDKRLLPCVERACHAVAIDDERLTFHPEMWEETAKRSAMPARDPADSKRGLWRRLAALFRSMFSKSGDTHVVTGTDSRIEQVWFPGVHSNVGGGYPRQGVSLVALHWMMRRAEAAGLEFVSGAIDDVGERMNISDKLYDSRAGMAVYFRYRPRNVWDELRRPNEPPQKIHVSAFERVGQGFDGYTPILPKKFEVTGVDQGVGKMIADLCQIPLSDLSRERAWQSLASFPKNPPSEDLDAHRDSVKQWVGWRTRNHFYFFALTILLVVLPWLMQILLPQRVVSSVILLNNSLLLQVGTGVLLLLLLVVAYLFGLFGRWRLEKELSRFWHRRRPIIRELLGPSGPSGRTVPFTTAATPSTVRR